MHEEKIMRGNVTYGDVVHVHLWYVTAERHEPDLVCQVLRTQVDGNDDVVNTHWQDIEGIVTLITEEQRRVDPSGLAVGVVDTRTRLVVRRTADPEGNGSPVGFEPLVVDPTGEDIGGIGDYRTLRFVRREDARDASREEVENTGSLTAYGLLRDFTLERLQTTTVKTKYVRLPVAFNAYTSWCDERSILPRHQFTYPEFVSALGQMWGAVSDAPVRLPSGTYEYVLEQTAFIGAE